MLLINLDFTINIIDELIDKLFNNFLKLLGIQASERL